MSPGIRQPLENFSIYLNNGSRIFGIILAMSASYTYWQDTKDGMWLGYWNEYPDYQTEGHTLAELQFMLRDIRDAIRDGDLVDTRRNVGELDFA